MFSCPFDYIKVYDGPTNEADVIDIFCGRLSNISLFSTSESLHVDFVTKSGRAEATKKTYFTYDDKQVPEIQRRGFKANFEISNSFISLGKNSRFCHLCELCLVVLTILG